MAKKKIDLFWNSRIVGLGRKPASQFTHHPQNPKFHPKAQREALKGVISEIGVISTPIENITTGYLIDGHERVWLALETDAEVDYLKVELSEEEELFALATFDPIGMMAQHDKQQLGALLKEVKQGDERVQQMLSTLAQESGIIPPDFLPVDASMQPRLDEKQPITCPHCQHEFVPK